MDTNDYQPEDFEAYLAIDINELDENLIQQPDLFNTVSMEYAYAASRRDEAKDNLAYVDSEIYKEVRTQAEEAGQKITEKQIEAEVNTHPRHQEAYQAWLDAKLEADRWNALKDSFQQRSHMMRELVELFVTGYFSPGSVNAGQDQSSAMTQARADKNRKGMADSRRDLRAERGETTDG